MVAIAVFFWYVGEMVHSRTYVHITPQCILYCRTLLYSLVQRCVAVVVCFRRATSPSFLGLRVRLLCSDEGPFLKHLKFFMREEGSQAAGFDVDGSLLKLSERLLEFFFCWERFREEGFYHVCVRVSCTFA